MTENLDKNVVAGFGDEWSRFDQSALDESELREMFENYFNIFPWHELPKNSVGFDLGCGSGRWARLVAPRVGTLHLIDPSDALDVAKKNLKEETNCIFHRASVEIIPLDNGSCDFGYSLGVLHHVPDTEAGLRACVEKLKKGAPFLLYLYYRFDNKPPWFRAMWKASDAVRGVISRLPHSSRYVVSQVIAATVYLPLARTAKVLERSGANIENFPLSQYRNNSFYTMRTDALDRFGTRLERRFTKAEMKEMMERSGLENITFNQTSFWTAVGYKA
ncbi:MAG: SAM-dependent methyltransferase [Acidobacteria bacterium]|nr:MAG: SAM-dependent methyltransferase [Acidobacteriota bacterium]